VKIALVTANFPPRICGVGDHSFFLGRELAKQHELVIYTGAPEGSVEWAGLRPLREIENAKADCVLLQYTPYLYSERYGLAPWLLRAAQRLTGRSRLVLLAHELHYPVEASLAGLTIGPLQKLQFRRLAKLASQVIFTYETPLTEYSDARFSWMPVGSNIPVTSEAAEGNILLHFGGAHPTHGYDFVLAAATKLERPVHCLGITTPELEKWLGRQTDALIALGRLPAAEISRWLSRSSLVLAPFMDGISSRRGSAMAAFAHGKAVLSTRGSSTNASIPWNDFCFFPEQPGPEAFAARAAELSARQNLGETGQRALAFYERNFSWPVLAARLLEKISR
jgi:glycosyltransferase involved in cell wall biosynthesis